eukprot:753656-Hanusia_phi.AAC.2
MVISANSAILPPSPRRAVCRWFAIRGRCGVWDDRSRQELQYLSHITGDPKYAAAADRSIAKLLSLAMQSKDKPENPLYPVDVHPREGKFVSDRVSLGSGGDRRGGKIVRPKGDDCRTAASTNASSSKRFSDPSLLGIFVQSFRT